MCATGSPCAAQARYVNQFDLHNAQLTVRETLTFSAMCQGEGYNRGATSP